jgi:hypothetical protein
MDSAALEDLVRRFRSCTLTYEEWTHHAHLAVGAWYVAHLGGKAALVSLRSEIRRLNDAHGTPNSETRGYHETITRAYVVLIEQFLTQRAPSEALCTSVGELLASPLATRNFLEAFWSRELLLSSTARLGWVEPDRAALVLR